MNYLCTLLVACGSLFVANSNANCEPPAKEDTPVKIIEFGGGGWKDGQVNEPIVIVNPRAPRKLIMFFSGMKLGGSFGTIGKAWANASEPFVWHEDAANPILSYDPSIPFEASGIRLDSVIYNAARKEYWIYYTGSSSKGDAIGLAVCPIGNDGYSEVTPANIKRKHENPILAPGGQGRIDETHVSQGAVLRDHGRWYSLYSYRTGDKVLPGVRIAESKDGIHWIKAPGPDLLASAPEQRYLEWHQVYRLGKRWVMLYEGYNGGTRWGADIAVSNSLTSGWKKLPAGLIDQRRWTNYSDDVLYHIATPAAYKIGGQWYLYFQGASSGFYSYQHWALWGLELKSFPPK